MFSYINQLTEPSFDVVDNGFSWYSIGVLHNAKRHSVAKPIEFTTIMKQNGSTITATANMNISRANWNINLQQKPKSWNLFDGMKDHLIDNDIQ